MTGGTHILQKRIREVEKFRGGNIQVAGCSDTT